MSSLQFPVLEPVPMSEVREERSDRMCSTNTQFYVYIPGLANFDRSRYLGSWYENANVFEFYQIGSTCVRATYTDEGSKIGVFNEQVNAM